MRITEAMRSMIETMDRHIDAPPDEKLKLLFSGTYRFYVARWVYVFHGEIRLGILDKLIEDNEKTWDAPTNRKAIELRKFLRVIYNTDRKKRDSIYLFSLKYLSGHVISFYLKEYGDHFILYREEVQAILNSTEVTLKIELNYWHSRILEWLMKYFYDTGDKYTFCCPGLLDQQDWDTIKDIDIITY